jgi:hypothetical protein
VLVFVNINVLGIFDISFLCVNELGIHYLDHDKGVLFDRERIACQIVLVFSAKSDGPPVHCGLVVVSTIMFLKVITKMCCSMSALQWMPASCRFRNIFVSVILTYKSVS